MSENGTRPSSARPAKRSRKGCPECKSRRVKCDEERPQCGQCARQKRKCTIVDSIFRPDPRSSDASTQLARRSVSLQPEVGAVAEEAVPEQPIVTTMWSNTSQLAAPAVHQNDLRELRELGELGSPTVPAAPFAASPLVVTPAMPTSPDDARTLYTPRVANARTASSHVSPGQVSTVSELSQEEEEEVAFFSRAFNEGAAKWLDLISGSQCFTQRLPLVSRRSVLIRYAACAVAAKQLGQVGDLEAFTSRTQGLTLAAENLLKGELDFNWYGAKYYAKAIQLLARHLSHGSPSWSTQPSPSMLYDLNPETSEESPVIALMVACLLSLYEMLSATVSMSAWGGHLDGVYKLLQHYGEGTLFTAYPMVLSFPVHDIPDIQASFWWFALSDLEQSFATQSCTRVNVSDLALWRHMGLTLDDDGNLDSMMYGQNANVPTPDGCLPRAIIRVVCGVVNAVAITSSGTDGDMNSAERIREYLAALPGPPQPDYHWSPGPPDAVLTRELFGKEAWFSRSFVAVSAALYHMAHSLLLTSAPIPTTIRSQKHLLRASHSLQSNLRRHAAEIIAIALGTREASLRVHLLQPLYIAGQCLTENADRVFLIKLIRALEIELGIMSEYRVSNLVDEWNTTYAELGLSPIEVLRRKDFWD